jgi:hypothetical protein
MITKEQVDLLRERIDRAILNDGTEVKLPVGLVRPNGQPVPKHWSVFRVGEEVVIKDYTFKVAYIGESNILFEPVGPVVIGEDKPCPQCNLMKSLDGHYTGGCMCDIKKNNSEDK